MKHVVLNIFTITKLAKEVSLISNIEAIRLKFGERSRNALAGQSVPAI